MANITDLGNSKYKIIISNGYKSNGTRNRLSKTVQVSSKRELNKIVKKMEAKFIDKDMSIKNDIVFIELIERWREKHIVELEVKTIERYEQILMNSIIPWFGRKQLRHINGEIVEKYMKSLEKDGVRRDGKKGGYSEQTKLHYFRLLSSLLEFGVQNNYIESNICTRIKAPSVKRKERKEYRMEQIYEIQKNLRGVPLKYKLFIELAIATGARKGEILGLDWKDIDFESRELHLCRTSMVVKGLGIHTKDELKNGDTVRRLILPNEVIDTLKEYKLYQEKYKEEYKEKHKGGWIEMDRLFIQCNGKAMDPSTPAKWFSEFQKNNELKRITLHEIRHIAISTLIRSGMDIVKVSKWAGHKEPEITLRVYAHVLDERKEEEAQIIANSFFRKSAV